MGQSRKSFESNIKNARTKNKETNCQCQILSTVFTYSYVRDIFSRGFINEVRKKSMGFMGEEEEDDVNASIAHIVLCCVAGRGFSRMHGRSYTHPGMHVNFFIHGILGFLYYQSGRKNNDIKPAYDVSYKATRYLALPCLNADLYRADASLSSIHLVSGLLPFALALAGNDNVQLGNMAISCNIISLCHYSLVNNREWGWYTAGAGVVAYFLTPKMRFKVLYPLGLALMEYCGYRVFHIHYEVP